MRLLVVDAEEVICHACGRIFSRQGFVVEKNTDACEALKWATERTYAAVLLDIKMPKMNGIQFLEKLREHNPEVPVLIMTGYPSIPDAAAAIRLGASDYITKPFTPEEITQAVQRMLGLRRPAETEETRPMAPLPADTEAVAPEGEDFLFLDEAWLRLEKDGSACVGAVLPRLQGAMIESVRVPKIGEVVYQGLPLAGVSVVGKPAIPVLAPVSGVIAAVNERVTADPSLLSSDPCGEGWIACICTTRYESEAANCRPRRLVLVNSDAVTAEKQAEN
jgi:CheY-like chemotaxis protein/glycine cleavage system H lipoate-binding protein